MRPGHVCNPIQSLRQMPSIRAKFLVLSSHLGDHGRTMSSRPAPSADSRPPAWKTPDTSVLSGVVSAREAAATLGVSERTIRRAIQRGELAATKQGRSFQIAAEAL